MMNASELCALKRSRFLWTMLCVCVMNTGELCALKRPSLICLL